MALLTASALTLFDIANMPDNKDVSDMINLMAQFNPILTDAPAYPCNSGLKHKTTVRTGLPTATWGRLYKGIPSTKGTRQTVEDTTGFLESASEVETRLVDFVETALEKASIRFEEAEGHYEALSQEMATAIFYHDTNENPEKPMGLAPRFSDPAAENGSHLIDGGGVGSDNTSIWMITWDKKTVHLIYPKNGKAGIEKKDRGEIPVTDDDGNRYFVYREEFKWHIGITVRDWRYVVRICNIDVSLLSADAASGADLDDLMTDMYYKHQGRRQTVGKTVIYANTTIVKFLDKQVRSATNKNLNLSLSETGPNAKEVLKFRGIPIHESDAILNSEAAITGF